MPTAAFVRHGQSTDNLLRIWAGTRDAPLSEIGEAQVLAVAKVLATINFHCVYASPRKRARSTAEAIIALQSTNLEIETIENLREQDFGEAEGTEYFEMSPDESVDEYFRNGRYPALLDRNLRYPKAESQNDVRGRVEKALKECIFPHLQECDKNILIVGHGFALSEMIHALFCLDPERVPTEPEPYLNNSGWTRVQISLRDGFSGPIDAENRPFLNVEFLNRHESKHIDSVHVNAAVMKSPSRLEREEIVRDCSQ